MEQNLKRRQRRGSALMLIVCLGICMVILGFGMLRLGLNVRLTAARTVQDIAARCAADAGLKQAIFSMNKKLVDEMSWNNHSLPSASNVVVR